VSNGASSSLSKTVDTGISGLVVGQNVFFVTNYVQWNPNVVSWGSASISVSVSGTKVTVKCTEGGGNNLLYDFRGTIYVLY
jgi:hypothetical protein